jgi:hypothetical protein
VGSVLEHHVYPNHLFPPFTLLTGAGPHGGRDQTFSPGEFISPLLNTIFFNKNKWKMGKGSNGNEKLQIIYRRKAITKEN